jgi:hypothetical protein
MPRIAKMTDALRGRGKALAFVGAAAALAGAGTASAATLASSGAPAPAVNLTAAHHAPAAHLGADARPAALRRTAAASRPAAARPAAAPRKAATHEVAAHEVAAHTVASHAAAPRKAARPAVVHHAPAAPAKPYEMYDSVTPSAIPGGKAVAVYADGGYAASPSQVTGHGQVTWIDTNGSDPKGANALDVEPGDATPTQAASWAHERLTAHPGATAVIYTMRSDWAAAKAAVSSLPKSMQSHVKWWIADPTGVAHIVPGASATQWYWGTNYDISSVAPGF